ncbi:hypothetical protein [Kosakonia sp. H7A]|nr:hypothetical protein [Kosakonia sp. H7A]
MSDKLTKKERPAFERWYATRPLPGSDKKQQFTGWIKALEGKL